MVSSENTYLGFKFSSMISYTIWLKIFFQFVKCQRESAEIGVLKHLESDSKAYEEFEERVDGENEEFF